MMELQKKIVRTADVVSAPVQEELVMFDVDAGKYYGLNQMAAAIWRCLENPVTVAALCAELLNDFDVSPEQCRLEVLAFLSKLETKGLIRTVEQKG
ncbi:MAG: HPr-rel-A system PqqD family peptide chaperone [Deltaproteobacteria bacterium]